MLGTKAENLLTLKKKKFNIPDFIVIKQEDVIKKEISSKTLCGKTTQELQKLSNELKKQIERNFNLTIQNSLKGNLYAVRSSSNLEDGQDASFAGQFATYLNVKEKELYHRVLDCFKSLYNVNVLEYLTRMNKSLEDLKMNVIIQEMIPSEISGVLFTSNPQGLLNESIISVAKGLGENVVSDKADTTTYYYNTTDKCYYYTGKIDILSKNQIEELLHISNEIEKVFGKYLDIEFAIYKDKIYILQTRKITTIHDNNPLVLDNSNIVESYPGISLPLTCSFVHAVYSGVFKGVCGRILQNEKELNALNNVFENMVGTVNGRIYYKISNWYTIIKYLPLSKKIIPIWQEMLGIKNKNYNEDDLKLPLNQKIRIYKNSITELFKVPKNMEKLNEEFIKVNNYFYTHFHKNISPIELKQLYDKIKNKLLSCWDITLLNDMYTFMFTGLLKNRLNKKYPNNQDLANKYISGITNIESMKPIKELISIANECGMESSHYKERKKSYIKVYGDRNLEELKLESETFRTNDKLFDQKIKDYQEDRARLQEIYQNINAEEFKPIDEDTLTKYLIDKCMLGIKNREISRLNRSRIYGMVREIFLYYGTYFTDNKIIKQKEDIFYLTVDEIFNNLSATESLKSLVHERKQSYAMYKELPAYTRLIFMDKEFNKVNTNININIDSKDQNTLYGTPCSNGIVEGEAIVIEDINKIGDVKDKILVTKMTDPGWVFLLATAKGIISEKGSLLSHTAIISRELKIPSVVGVSDLLKTIKTKDIIRMNANTGKIEIIKKSR